MSEPTAPTPTDHRSCVEATCPASSADGPTGHESGHGHGHGPRAGDPMVKLVAALVCGLVLVVTASLVMPTGSHAGDDRADHHGHAGHLDHGHDMVPGTPMDPDHDLGHTSEPAPGEVQVEIEGGGAVPHEALGDVSMAGRTMLGQLEDGCHVISIWLDPRGPRYSVTVAGTGEILVDYATRADLTAALPDLVVPEVAEGGMSRLMLVDPGYWGLEDH